MAENNGFIHPYQGKDIVSKVLVNTYGSKTFEVYGLEAIPAIKRYLPTDLPTIDASDRISDHVFLLEDDSYAIVDYESAYKSENKIKYLEYATRLVKRYFVPGKEIKIRIIVIYTCDVDSAENIFDAGALKLTVQQAFLSHIDGEKEYRRIREKIEVGEALRDEDLMRLVILPLTKKGNDAKIEMIDKVISTATDIKSSDENAASFVLSAMLVAMGNYITNTQENRIKEVLDMTSLGLRYAREAEEREERVRNVTRAEDLVESVENIANNGNMSIEDACRMRGTDVFSYTMAKEFLGKTFVAAN